MTENREDLLQHYRHSRQDLLSAIDRLSAGILSEPSLDGWSVKDHLAHLALWDDLRAAEVTRISAGFDSAWRMTGDQDNAFNAIAYEVRRNLTPAQARWELDASRERLLDAIAAATEQGLDGSRYGEAGLRSSHEAQHASWIRRWCQERGL